MEKETIITISCTVLQIPIKFPVDTKVLPPLYIITPTYRRPEQLAEITRLGYTLKHVPNLFWLIVEDAENRTETVTRLLKQINVPFIHLTGELRSVFQVPLIVQISIFLLAPMPAKYRKLKVKPRGVSNRNRGLQWIRANATEGVLYFADDDNTYNLQIFEQVRSRIFRNENPINSYMYPFSDALHPQGGHVARWPNLQVRRQQSDCGQWVDHRVLRRVDRRSQVSNRYGRICSERKVPSVPTQGGNALQGWVRGGWLPEKFGSAGPEGNRSVGIQLH